MSITVKWNKKRYIIPFDPDTTLNDLKKKCHEETHIPIDRMKLVFNGATMKDNKAPLSKFGIQNGSIVMLMGSVGEKIKQPDKARSQDGSNFYQMPKPNTKNPQEYINEQPSRFNPGYPQEPGFYVPQQGYPPQGYGYPPQNYNYPPQGYGYPPQGYNYPPQPNPAFLSSPTQNPSQTIRNQNGDYYGQNPYYQPPPGNPYGAPPSNYGYPPQGASVPPNGPYPPQQQENPYNRPPPYDPNAPRPPNGLYPNIDNGQVPNQNQNQNQNQNNMNTQTSSTDTTSSKRPLSKEELTEQAKNQPLFFLDNCIKETREELEPLVNTYAIKVDEHPTGQPMTKELEQCYLRASELLMQKLLLVDQVMAGQNEEIRSKRKTAVKLIQGLIDKIDEKKSQLKQKIGN